MEAASRPSLELLPDLPLEEPLDATAPPREPPTLAPATPAAAPTKDLEQTDLHFIDPEMFLAPDDPSRAVPIAPPAAASVEQPLELVLEDPVIDELLTSPVPPTPPAAASPPLTATRPAPAAPRDAVRSGRSNAQAPAATRVPIAKSVALSAAAAKL